MTLDHLRRHPAFVPVYRALLIVSGIVLLLLTFAFYTRAPLARALWPWSYTTLSDLSYVFLASIAAAIAVPLLWIGLSGELAAVVGGTFDLGITFGASALFMLQSHAVRDNPRALVGAGVCLLLCLELLFLYLLTRPLSYHDPRPMPRPVRVSFAFFALALVLVGTALVLRQPVFPWRLSGEASIVYGWIFLGAAAYFLYGVYRPLWSNAAGQLAGFLAYDLVLIFPFLARFADVEPEYRLSLTVYVAVILYSAALAVFYLFIVPRTRLFFARPDAGVG